MTDTIGYINIFSGIIQILMGLVTFWSDRSDKIKRYYFFSALSLGLWSIGLYFYANPILFDSTIWLKIVYTMAYCMTLGLILFARVYPVKLEKKFRIFLILNLIYMAVIGLVLWFTPYILVDTHTVLGQFNSIATMGPWYFLYGLPEFVTAVYVVGYYIKQATKLEGIEKKQVQFYVAGGIIMLIPVILFDFVFPLAFNNTEFYKFSTIGNSVWTLIVGYSILTTRFLDVKVIFGSVISIITKSLLLLSTLFLLVYVVFPWLQIGANFEGFLKLLPFAVVLTLIANKAFGFIDYVVASKYIYTNYHPVKTLRQYVNENSDTIKMTDVGDNLIRLIIKSFKSDFASLILFDSNNNVLTNQNSGSNSIKIEDLIAALDVWKNLNSNRILIFSELKKTRKAGQRRIDVKREAILNFMEENSVEIVFSLVEEGRFNGVVLVGKKYDRNLFTTNDIDFLDNIMQNTHMALTRAYLYTELQSFNQTLQSKVDAQTQELQIKVEELQEARRKENDMIDIMGHELRTPATIVKLNAQLLEKFTGDIKSDPEAYKRYVDRIKMAVENEIKLINTLLSSAKLEGDKIVIDPEEIDINGEIEMAIHGNERDAKEKNLPIINNSKPETPHVYADKARVVEILNNLISNAVKYTDKGSVTVENSYDDNFVEISITDTGNGISAEDLPKLGQKFYRAGNYIESGEKDQIDIVRPGGTGLGLFVTFNLIRKMGGDIHVESEVGKGSKFIFTLPIYKAQAIHDHDGDSNNMFDRLGLKKP